MRSTDYAKSVSATNTPICGKAVSGVVNVTSPSSSNCGDSDATTDITAVSGPNGNINWLNCGINSTGWSPPYVKVSQIITVDLSDAIKSPQSPFVACTDYIPLFEKYGKSFNVPPILMASFAMQESSCKADAVGAAGEQGLMQLSQDKCARAPNGNCRDPDYNIQMGTEYFASMLGRGGNLLESIGAWNGWFPHMTYDEATAAANTSCCPCQKNLDYLHQVLNGWCMNVNAYTNVPRLGLYFNLDKCRF